MFTRQMVLCLILGSSIVLRVSADEIDVKKVAKAKAEEVQAALIKGEFGKVVDLTHPRVVELAGGKEKMIAAMTKGLKSMEEKGFSFKSCKVSDPLEPIKTGKQLYLVIPIQLEIKAPNIRFSNKGSLVGFSEDNGKSWVFVDTSPGREKIKEILPNIPDSLIIPKKEPPTIIED